jgi:2-C-methyl-D-erythritol 2,4-cyclodiphosphate synthase
MEDFRVGQGFDAHRLVEGRKLILAGVTIPHPRGLLGHSDADVLAHAVMDAILGALALGDIGAHFPPNDPAYQDADSMALLGRVAAMAKAQGWRVRQADATVIAEAPRLLPYVQAMRENLARVLAADLDRVSVKATTTEGMGFAGRGEGIAAMAVVALAPLAR